MHHAAPQGRDWALTTSCRPLHARDELLDVLAELVQRLEQFGPLLSGQVTIAQRSASRMLLVPPDSGALADLQVRDLPGLLQPGDLLVFNDTRVIPARLFGSKDSGGRVEILIERLLPGDQARAQVRASKSPRAGGWIELDGGGRVQVLGREGEFYLLDFEVEGGLEPWLLKVGRLPLPPYIRREPGQDDAERYQTVFARQVGAVAAPTAGLHFDEPLLAAAERRKVDVLSA